MNQSSTELAQRFHGTAPPRGLDQVAGSPLFEGRFGRMFRNLPAFEPDDKLLGALAASMIEPDAAPSVGGQDAADPLDNPAISAGYTYLGACVSKCLAECDEHGRDSDCADPHRDYRFRV